MAVNIIDRTGAEALIPAPLATEIFQGVTEGSAFMQMARRLPNMTNRQLRLPILNSLPYAYFVNGDTGLKGTTKADWANKYITAEEIAVIVPVPDAVLDDAGFDIWGQIRPLVVQAFGQVIDRAVLYGTEKPASWPAGIVTEATAKGNYLARTANLYSDIMGESGLIALVEQDGYMVNGYIGALPIRGALRDVRTEDGLPIFKNSMQDGSNYSLDGQSITFPMNGAIDPAAALLIGGDFNQAVYAIRQDLTVKLLTEAAISDSEGKIIYNLAQQDMKALRFVMRLGWELPNPVNAVGGANRYPFAVLKPAG